MATEKTMGQRRQPCRTPVYTLKNDENLSLYSPSYFERKIIVTQYNVLSQGSSPSPSHCYMAEIMLKTSNTKQSIMDVESSLLFKNLHENDVEQVWSDASETCYLIYKAFGSTILSKTTLERIWVDSNFRSTCS